jgi:hypothetical protein
VTAIEGSIASGRVRFETGDGVIGLPVNLGPHTYFASNQPVNPADRAAGRLPEERHADGFQPLALFQFRVGDLFSGESNVGPHVPGTVESNSPRTPDSRPRAQGLVPLTPGERAAFPFPSLLAFSEDRISKLLTDFVALKEAGQTDTQQFRNLRLRIGHLLPDVSPTLRSKVVSDHADVNVVPLPPNAGFAYGQFREVYRGMIDSSINVTTNVSPVLDYLSDFATQHFLAVFFNFHTDEACAHVYGAVDPTQPPSTL